ncbi:hypothetical protein QAD02_005951 [Eretmocerus hayati]|uniref:Uncharacterized protein n=1 Tax=Eretmocerus hayati TaxID=131215 RepID=A0ACC2MZY7_9HYME|nr:hypothetical protein QAD02_005951 [Eretmocerus hayati]
MANGVSSFEMPSFEREEESDIFSKSDSVTTEDDLLFLERAIQDNKPHHVKCLLEKGVDVNYGTFTDDSYKKLHRNKEKFLKKFLPPIYAALKSNSTEMTELLIQKGANVNVKNIKEETPLFYAVKTLEKSESKIQLVELLLKHGAKINEYRMRDMFTVLHVALYLQDEDLANYLIKAGCSSTQRNCDDESPIVIAVTLNLLSSAKLLLESGADVNDRPRRRKSILWTAIHNNNVEMVKLLMKHNVNFGKKKMRDDDAPLVLAAHTGNVDIAKIFVEAGANINVTDSLYRPVLHLALSDGHYDVALLFLRNRVRLNQCDLWKVSPLHSVMVGASRGHDSIQMIEYLLNVGVDMNAEDKDGRTALTYQPSSNTGREPPESFTCAKLILVKYIAVLNMKNSHISSKNMEFIEENNILREYHLQCKRELELMKATRITFDITYFNLLTDSNSEICMHVREPSVKDIFRSDLYKCQFPHYSTMLFENYERSMKILGDSPKKKRRL